MFKTILVILCFFFCVFPLQCDDGDCDDKNNLQLPEETQIGDIISPIDEKIRKQFWYFLKNAKLIYQINMDSMQRFFLIFIYENQFGLFLCQATWEKETQESDIQNFMRLGNGENQNANPFHNEALIISLKLESKEYLVERDENGQFTMKGKEVDFMKGGQVSMEMMKKKQKMARGMVQNLFGYYLQDGSEVHHQTIMSNERVFMVLTYMGKMGKFLALCSCDNSLSVKVNLFMRLGDEKKGEEKQKMKPCVLELN